jgi:hypothetical protein
MRKGLNKKKQMSSSINSDEMKKLNGYNGQKLNIYKKVAIILNTFISLLMENIGKRKFSNWNRKRGLLLGMKI